MQRASDAAALAAVVHMPDEVAATAAARDAATRNGYAHGVDGVSVVLTPSGIDEVEVTITDPTSTFFARIIVEEIDITRESTAAYADSVPLGNPTSAIGSADLDLDGVSTPSNHWLIAHAYDLGVAAGDLFNSFASNPFYNDRGYVYRIDKPENVAVEVQVLHAGRCKRPNWDNSRGESHGVDTPIIDFELFRPDTTPRNYQDNLVPANQFGARWSTDHSTNVDGDSLGDTCPTFNPDGTWDDPKWVTMFTLPAASTQGNWYLTAGTPPLSVGHKNMYGLRVVGSNLPAGQEFCSALDPSTVTGGECATINALDRIAVYIGENRPDPATPVSDANFYFAEIAEVHAGKTMKIELWDPGEGSQFLQFLNPQGVSMPFRYKIDDRYGNPIVGWTDTLAPCSFDTSTNHCMPAAHHDRLVTIEVELEDPAGGAYTCNGDDCWWKVRYASTADVDDTTTWSVEIIGSPVRLVE